MADPARAARMAKRIQEVVAAAIEREVKDRRLELVTITDCRVTGDLHDATVFYTTRGRTIDEDPDWEAAAEALHRARGERELGEARCGARRRVRPRGRVRGRELRAAREEPHVHGRRVRERERGRELRAGPRQGRVQHAALHAEVHVAELDDGRGLRRAGSVSAPHARAAERRTLCETRMWRSSG